MDIVEKVLQKPISSEINGAQKLNINALTPPPSEIDVTEPIYDYMKYANNKKKKGKGGSTLKNAVKRVTFKTIVEQVSFTDDWKMLTSESKLRTEEEQV